MFRRCIFGFFVLFSAVALAEEVPAIDISAGEAAVDAVGTSLYVFIGEKILPWLNICLVAAFPIYAVSALFRHERKILKELEK